MYNKIYERKEFMIFQVREGYIVYNAKKSFQEGHTHLKHFEAAKTAIVDLIEVRLARGMCGKSYLMLTGEVAAVEAAIDRAKEAVSDDGMYLDSAVIAHPDAQIRDAIL